ncbi:MAG TPA: hypothetical protein EYP10_00625 [Armatimonadetes bacterium]|nr:hypothetical protein [Armatimonadota bacterium]
MRTIYEVADQLVGEIVSRFDLNETTVVIASDDGMPPNRKAVSLFNLFRQHGLVAVRETRDGRLVPDWANSRVFYSQNHLWVNLQGRDPNGIVPADEYEQTVQLVLKLLRGLTDPETGEHVIAVALRREDAPLIGLWGQNIGDVVFVYAGGYRWTGAEVLQLGEERVVFPSGGANHGPQLPSYETDVSSNYGILLMAGAGIRSNYVRDYKRLGPPCTTDIAPTVAHLIGIPTPAQSEGAVLFDMLINAPPPPRRELKPLPWRIRPHRPRRVTLAGDVTDEI